MSTPTMMDERQPLRQQRQSQKRTSILLKNDDVTKNLDKEFDKSNNEDDDDDDDKYEKYNKQQQRHAITLFDTFQHAAEVSLNSNRVDAFLAALGCAGTLALLQYVSEKILPGDYEVSGGFLVSSSIKFFFNESPPSLDSFCRSTVFALVAGFSLAFAPSYFGSYTKFVLLFVFFVYWKLQGGLWGAANTLALVVAVESGGWMTTIINLWDNTFNHGHQPKFPWQFLFFPYISGHLLLYGMACLMSIVRRNIRVLLIRREFFHSQQVANQIQNLRRNSIVTGTERRRRLRMLFERMDTNGDGQLDAVELQVALRAATGNDDISMADTTAMIQSVDSDGNGTLDFDEFCASIEKLWLE